MSNNGRKYSNEINRDRKKSGAAKTTNVVKQAKKLRERMQIEGDTKWLQNAMKRVETRAKKYGVAI